MSEQCQLFDWLCLARLLVSPSNGCLLLSSSRYVVEFPLDAFSSPFFLESACSNFCNLFLASASSNFCLRFCGAALFIG